MTILLWIFVQPGKLSFGVTFYRRIVVLFSVSEIVRAKGSEGTPLEYPYLWSEALPRRQLASHI